MHRGHAVNQISPSPIIDFQGLGAEPLEGSGFEKEQPDSFNEQEEELDVDDD